MDWMTSEIRKQKSHPTLRRMGLLEQGRSGFLFGAFRARAFFTSFGFARFGDFGRGIFAAFSSEFFRTGFASLGVGSGFLAAFASESGLREGHGGNNCGNGDVTD